MPKKRSHLIAAAIGTGLLAAISLFIVHRIVRAGSLSPSANPALAAGVATF